jgi:HEAT repeat protein
MATDSAPSIAALAGPFEALVAYDWAADAAPFKEIDAAVIAAHADANLRAEVEKRLSAVLGPGTSRAAKEYACRKLCMIGTAASVPALAALLGDAEHSHMARFALERIPAAEAAAALRAALGTVSGDLKIGMISSLGSRGDAESVPLLKPLVSAEGGAIARAAAEALGMIATPAAAEALATVDPLAAGPVAAAAVDARLACAESFLRHGKASQALAIYQALATAAAGKPMARRIELAATRGLLACADTASAS